MNSTRIAEKFFKCSIPPHSSNRGWAHNSGQLEYCKIKLISDIDNYIYDIIDYENLVCMYFWLICLSTLLYINRVNPIIYIMKKIYEFSLYLVGYNEHDNEHDKMHILENKIESFEDKIKDLNNNLKKFTKDLNNDLNEYMEVIDKKILHPEYVARINYNIDILTINDRLCILENSHTSKSLYEPD